MQGRDTPLLLLRSDVAQRLRISVRSVDRLRQRGELRGLQIGGSVRFTQAELERLMAGHDDERNALTSDRGDFLHRHESDPLLDVTAPRRTRGLGPKRPPKPGISKRFVPPALAFAREQRDASKPRKGDN